MKHPAAFVPGRVAADELRALVQSLRLQGDGLEPGLMPDGRRKITATAASVTAVQRFPAKMDSDGNILLPPLFVDFGPRFYIAPRTERPRTSYSISWLRLVVNATYTTDTTIVSEYPVLVTINSFRFDWLDRHDDTTNLPLTSPDPVVAGVPVDYYFYLVKVNAGQIVTRAASCEIIGSPPQQPPLP